MRDYPMETKYGEQERQQMGELAWDGLVLGLIIGIVVTALVAALICWVF